MIIRIQWLLYYIMIKKETMANNKKNKVNTVEAIGRIRRFLN